MVNKSRLVSVTIKGMVSRFDARASYTLQLRQPLIRKNKRSDWSCLKSASASILRRRHEASITVSKYLVRCHHIHVFRSEIPMYNVINMKVVKRGRHLRHKHDYVPMFASPVKNVFLQVTIRAHL